ncbi:MAG: permease [Candidatus Sericytochromatia bacterium]
MLSYFTYFADWLTFSVLKLSPQSKLGDALHFFIEDTTKIYFLLAVMIYGIALLRASLKVERVRDFLARRHRVTGYVMGALFGAITPFCSCSSIPLFLGFCSAGIPLGVTLAFLITSPLINEVAVIMLLELLGWKLTLAYVLIGLGIGTLAGAVMDLLKAERWLVPEVAKVYLAAEARKNVAVEPLEKEVLSWKERHEFARDELQEIFGRVWKWVLIGVGLGAGLHGFVPAGFFEQYLGAGQWWTVPAAVFLGIPLYSNATGVIPVMKSLLLKGMPIGTTLAFCMSTVAASFPEFILLKQVMQLKLLALVFGFLLLAFSLVGWLLNAWGPLLLK